MSKQPIEIILSRQLADHLVMPVFIVDPIGNLIYYNEMAEDILGLRFSETGVMEVEDWSTVFEPKDEDGHPMPPEDLPLVQTLSTKKPANGEFWINSLRGANTKIGVSSYPIIGRPNRYLGAVAIFWKIDTP